MTYKNALAGLPFGGGKSGIIANPRELTKDQKVEIVKAFAKAIKPINPSKYIAAPDINMGEPDMRVFANANGSMKSTTGKPSNMCVKPGIKCGIPHEYGSTGFGTFAAKYLSKKGFKFVATSDSKGLIYNKKGLDYNKLMKVKKEKRTVTKYKPGTVMKGEKIVELNVDILITAAIPNIVNDKNYKKVKAKLIVEGSNIPMTPQVENKLHKKGILIIPDFVANAGGVISSYAEYKGHNPRDMFKLVEKKIVRNTKIVLKEANKKKHCKLRDVAMKIAISRLKKRRR
jgi:glutamate dehydrogenase/leucine dehydrogenase